VADQRGIIRAILFDFDGVLAETFPSHYAAWKEILSGENILVDKDTILLHEGASTYQIALALFAKNNLTISIDQARWYADRKNAFFQRHNTACLYPGIPEIVRFLKTKFQVGLVSGSPLKNIQSVLPDYLVRLFDVIIKDGDSKRGKPEPDPYLTALERLGVAPGESIVIENAPLGILAAKAAKCYCIAVTTTLPARFLSKADTVCKNHQELLLKIISISGV
jgi:beta-phosphoglucomutase